MSYSGYVVNNFARLKQMCFVFYIFKMVRNSKKIKNLCACTFVCVRICVCVSLKTFFADMNLRIE